MDCPRSNNHFDFVNAYVTLLSAITDAPKEFQEAAALFLISTAANRKWLFRAIPEASIFGNGSKSSGRMLNLWFILIGKSRITRKTSGVINHAVEMAQKVFGEQHMITEAFTPEALIWQMSKMYEIATTGKRETLCFWASDEIAWFFQQLKKKDSYMASAEAFLSKIYDGNTYSRSTITRGKEKIHNPYLTCLLASTNYLPTFFNELQIRLGFMNRFIYVVAERKERKALRTKPLTEEEKKKAKELEDFLKSLAERASVTMLEMSTEAKQIYDSFEEQIEKKIEEENLDVKEGYCGQLPNLVIRLSCLYRLSRMTKEEIQSYSAPTLVVEKQDVEKAIAYAKKAWKWFEKVIEIMQSAEKLKSSLPINRAKAAILECLADRSEKQVNEIKKYVCQRVKISQATFYNALSMLTDEGKVLKIRQGFYKLGTE